jgi:uncharacterized membrane protein HdeD (DUF308 family)
VSFAGPSDRTPSSPIPTNLLASLASAAWQVLLVTGIAAIVLGVVALAWTGATLAVVGAVFGIYLLASGILQLAGAFASHVPAQLRVLGLVSGALSVLLGLVCFRGPAQSILLLALWIGFGWLLRGIMMTSAALATPDLPAQGWQALLGVLTFIAGIVLIVAPFGSIATLAVVAGIWLIALGALEIWHGLRLRAHTRQITTTGSTG